MANPARPRNNPQTQPKERIKEHEAPQVAMLIHGDVMDKFQPEMKTFLTEMFGCYIFKDFCKFNMQKIEEDIRGLAFRPEWSKEEFFQLSKDMRLTLRFWTDLLLFAEDCNNNNRAHNER